MMMDLGTGLYLSLTLQLPKSIYNADIVKEFSEMESEIQYHNRLVLS